MRRSQGYFGFSSFGENGDNLKGTLESGEFGFYNDFTVRFDNVDYDQVAKMKNIVLFLFIGDVC